MKLNIFDMSAILDTLKQCEKRNIDLTREAVPLDICHFANEALIEVAKTSSSKVLLKLSEKQTGNNLPIAVGELEPFEAANLAIGICSLFTEEALDDVISILLTVNQRKQQMAKEAEQGQRKPADQTFH